MKRFILAAAAAGAFVMLQSPAHAQYPGPYQGPYQGPYNQGPYPQAPVHPPYNPQPYDQDRYEHGPDEGNPWDLDQRITWLEDRIARGQESGELDRDAAWRAQQEIEAVRHEEDRDRDRHDGRLTDTERQRLIDRVEAIGHELRWREEYREPWRY
jgi:hypothetical protein